MNSELQEHIHTLWDEMADMDVTQVDTATDHLMSRLCDLMNVKNAVWFGAVRIGDSHSDDPIKGWRVPVFQYLRPAQPLDAVTKEEIKRINKDDMVDQTTVANAAGAGRFRANRLCDLVPEEWFQSPFYEYQYRRVGNEDAVYVSFPINEDAESWFGFFRKIGVPRFTPEERDTLAYALRGLKWFHRQLMLSHGLLIAKAPLTPAERRVLQFLLSPIPEKEIGQNLGITANSAHQYVVAVYRKFGVNSRAALTSLWLGAN
ncbi:MAG: helix-turn-helix transcriptional regulator [Chloroflexi bacterium]|nr:helix-turn-helix transcriptional regulator [Chloroflexota bacterium]MBI3170638.1 helix-turn-helix transcriptional regulator [Chloroflexota bacterium]